MTRVLFPMSLGSLPQSRLKSASGLFNLMRNLGGAIGNAVSATMLNDRLNFHYYRCALSSRLPR